MMPGKCIFLSPLEEGVHYSSWGHKFTHSATHSSKNLDLCLPSYYYYYCWIGKNTDRNSAVLWCLLWDQVALWNSSLLLVLWMPLSDLFLTGFLVLYLGCGCMAFDFTTQMTSRHLYSMPMNKKLEHKDHRVYSKIWIYSKILIYSKIKIWRKGSLISVSSES